MIKIIKNNLINLSSLQNQIKNFKLKSLSLTKLAEHLTENRIINKKISGIKPELNTEKAFKNTNVIIDFTVPKCTIEVLKIASKLKKVVIKKLKNNRLY